MHPQFGPVFATPDRHYLLVKIVLIGTAALPVVRFKVEVSNDRNLPASSSSCMSDYDNAVRLAWCTYGRRRCKTSGLHSEKPQKLTIPIIIPAIRMLHKGSGRSCGPMPFSGMSGSGSTMIGCSSSATAASRCHSCDPHSLRSRLRHFRHRLDRRAPAVRASSHLCSNTGDRSVRAPISSGCNPYVDGAVRRARAGQPSPCA